MVVTVGELRIPVSVLNVTTTPDNRALEEFKALTVMVEKDEPSVLMDVGEAARSIDDAVTVDPPPDVPVRVMMTASDELLVSMVALTLTVSCKLTPEFVAPVV